MGRLKVLAPFRRWEVGVCAPLVLPDNCLFEGKADEVFEILMQACNLHTVKRLPVSRQTCRGARSRHAARA